MRQNRQYCVATIHVIHDRDVMYKTTKTWFRWSRTAMTLMRRVAVWTVRCFGSDINKSFLIYILFLKEGLQMWDVEGVLLQMFLALRSSDVVRFRRRCFCHDAVRQEPSDCTAAGDLSI